jgi:hypothetical protein
MYNKCFLNELKYEHLEGTFGNIWEHFIRVLTCFQLRVRRKGVWYILVEELIPLGN